MPAEARHFELLRSLVAAGVRFVTVGSAGLLLAHPEARARYELPDVDVLLERLELPKLVELVHRRGGGVTVWGEPWRDDLPLEGRFYARAVVDGLQLDATYEEPDFDLATLIREARWLEGIPVCADAPLWAMKLRKDEAAARAWAARVGLTPTSS